MKLESAAWNPVSRDVMYEHFWSSERNKKFTAKQTYGELSLPTWKKVRGPLLSRIPADTQWFEVAPFTEIHLGELLVIGRAEWDDREKKSDANELFKVAKRRPAELTQPPESWPKLILWGHSKKGPFTILEGNRRLVAFAGSERKPPLKLSVIVGLSPSPCCWHLPDPDGLFL